jgi:hypothetical protein
MQAKAFPLLVGTRPNVPEKRSSCRAVRQAANLYFNDKFYTTKTDIKQ